ncbi:CHAD domain-containing protein [Liquorilactobacillus capillatus]|uniref:CHAD domain protein n=1 Tax=Liquorilactobacillus capillatus DSM 19910 TaxID=1423731 RepID=A0A0R1M636_9LACO|nr:CHAD domain-containing protein [Liquorilactobacillus capillatus]KRL03542.1 CHAD domain protein [Liquorilactobacillus capillatus DSM 19910]
MTTIQLILQQQYASIQTELIRFKNNPYDPERIHDLRVTLRTLRGLFKFLKRKLPETTYTTIDHNLSQAAKLFSSLRDLDVLIINTGEFAAKHFKESTHYYQLFQILHTKREKEMHAILAPPKQQKLATALTRVKKQFNTLNFTKHSAWSHYISQELHRRKKKLFKHYQRLNFKDYPHVHRLRKQAKTLRYAATYFTDLLPKNSLKIAKHAKEIQSTCGIITDAHVNYTSLCHFAKRADNKAVQKLILTIAHTQQKIFNTPLKNGQDVKTP